MNTLHKFTAGAERRDEARVFEFLDTIQRGTPADDTVRLIDAILSAGDGVIDLATIVVDEPVAGHDFGVMQ